MGKLGSGQKEWYANVGITLYLFVSGKEMAGMARVREEFGPRGNISMLFRGVAKQTEKESKNQKKARKRDYS